MEPFNGNKLFQKYCIDGKKLKSNYEIRRLLTTLKGSVIVK